jgi:hypothetical protein
LVVAVALAIAFAWVRGRKRTLYDEVRQRPLVDARDQRAEVALDPSTTRDVLRALGNALGIEPRRLRLTDRLDALWDMQPHAGLHQRADFEDWLKKHYPKLPDDLYADTIGELIAALQRLPQSR